MKAVLVARDIAPSNALWMIYQEVTKSNRAIVEYSIFVGNGKPIRETVDQITAWVGRANVVLVGMSSSPELSKEEIATCEAAKKFGIPYGFYADTFGCAVTRNWFDCVRADASFVFVLNEKEAGEARKVFPKAKVIASGNPTWDDFFCPRLTREESRAKLGIKDDETFILCPGGKSLAINMQHWGFVLETLACMNERSGYESRKWQTVFSRHPGDQSAPDAYAELVKFSDIPVRVVLPDEMKSSDMIPGMDLMISCCSTAEIEAVCQRKPVISYIPHTGRVRMRTTMGDKWEPVEQEVVEAVIGGSIESMQYVIDDLLDYNYLQGDQEKFYPKPREKGIALRAIVRTLQEFAKK